MANLGCGAGALNTPFFFVVCVLTVGYLVPPDGVQRGMALSASASFGGCPWVLAGCMSVLDGSRRTEGRQRFLFFCAW